MAKTSDKVLALHVRETLKFFDDKSAMGHATAVVGVLGEDNTAGLFSHCGGQRLGKSEVMLSAKVVRGGFGTLVAPVDWVKWEKVARHAQTEIKNAPSHGTHGKKLALPRPKMKYGLPAVTGGTEIWDQ